MTKPDIGKRQTQAQMQLYGGDKATFPPIDVEVWLAHRLGDATIFGGLTTPEIRRERIRRRILADGRRDEIVGRRRADGVEETFGALFRRLYGVDLERPRQ